MTGTVKGVSWQILSGQCGNRLAAGQFDALVRDVGGPDVARTHPFDATPAGPFNAAVARVEAVLAGPHGAVAREAAAGVVRVWASMHADEAHAVRGADAPALVDVLARRVHPFVTGTQGGVRLVEHESEGVVLAFTDGLTDAYRAGLVEGVFALAEARADVAPLGDGRYRIAWHYPGPAPVGSRSAAVLQAVRAPFLTVAAVPVLVGAAAAVGVAALDPALLVLTLVGVVLLQAGMNVVNDWFDHKSGADAANRTPTRFSGGSRVLQRGLLSERAVAGLAIGLLAAGAAVGAALFLAKGLPVLWLGLAGVVVGVLYSAPPVKLAHRGLGEVAFGVIFGPLVVIGSAFVQAGTIPAAAVAASLPVAALVTAVLYVNEFPDLRGDAVAGKRTLVVRLGFDRAVTGYGVLVASAYGLVVLGVAFDLLPLAALLALATAPLAWWAFRTLRERVRDPFSLYPAQLGTLALHATTGLLLAAGLARGWLA